MDLFSGSQVDSKRFSPLPPIVFIMSISLGSTLAQTPLSMALQKTVFCSPLLTEEARRAILRVFSVALTSNVIVDEKRSQMLAAIFELEVFEIIL